MTPLLLRCTADAARLAASIEAAWQRDQLVGLACDQEWDRLHTALAGAATAGLAPGVVVGSGGSSGGRRWCYQPLSHLQASAAATRRWLAAQGISASDCLHLNPLPLHHVSGLMPLVRCRQWGAQLRWLPPELMRHPRELAASLPLPSQCPVLLSLVPTQLARLLACPMATAWLQGCALIWVGGASLGARLAAAGRQAGLRLSPCYGATETAAMVSALTPERFLAGEAGCGHALSDVTLRIEAGTNAVQVRTARLSPGQFAAGRLVPLAGRAGDWWSSGDAGRLEPAGLTVLGRRDGAIHSGGETVFPDQLEQRLLLLAHDQELPLQALLLLGQSDLHWGERLEALVRPAPEASGSDLLAELAQLVRQWPAAERPRRWHLCPELAPSAAGKWERQRWRQWLAARSGRPDAMSAC